MGCMSDESWFDSLQCPVFSPKRPDGLWVLPSLPFDAYRSFIPAAKFSRMYSWPQPHLVPRMSGATSLPCVPSWRAQGQFYCYFTLIVCQVQYYAFFCLYSLFHWDLTLLLVLIIHRLRWRYLKATVKVIIQNYYIPTFFKLPPRSVSLIKKRTALTGPAGLLSWACQTTPWLDLTHFLSCKDPKF